MGSLKIDVLGTSFTINASENDEYLQKLLGYYKKIILQIQKSGSLTNPVHISALAGIMLCDELYKEKSKSSQLSLFADEKSASRASESLEEQKKAGEIAQELIKKIEKVLG